MNKYVYSECPSDYFPTIKTIVAPSYNQAIEKLISEYVEQFDDDEIGNLNSIDKLQEYLNENYTFLISDLEDIEEL